MVETEVVTVLVVQMSVGVDGIDAVPTFGAAALRGVVGGGVVWAVDAVRRCYQGEVEMKLKDLPSPWDFFDGQAWGVCAS